MAIQCSWHACVWCYLDRRKVSHHCDSVRRKRYQCQPVDSYRPLWMSVMTLDSTARTRCSFATTPLFPSLYQGSSLYYKYTPIKYHSLSTLNLQVSTALYGAAQASTVGPTCLFCPLTAVICNSENCHRFLTKILRVPVAMFLFCTRKWHQRKNRVLQLKVSY